jgi:hypothetical protein
LKQKWSFKEEILSAFIHGSRRNFVSGHTTNTHTHIPTTTHPHIFPLYNPPSFDIILFWEFVTPTIAPLLPSTFTSTYPSPSASQILSLSMSQYLSRVSSKPRSGHITIHGLMLGATHAPLQGVIEEVENAKGKRSMYAETVRENMEMLEAIKACEWNMEMNPLDVVVKGTDDVMHDFSTG